MRGFWLWTLLWAPAPASAGCYYLDASAPPPRPVAAACPEEGYRYPDPMPRTPPGTIWLRRAGTREYWTEILLRDGPRGTPVPAPFPPFQPYPFAVIHRVPPPRGEEQLNPGPADYLTRAIVEAELRRPQWAASYARLGLVRAPGDPLLTQVLQRNALSETPPPVAFHEAEESFANGHRAAEHGDAAEALIWLDHSVALRATVQAFALRAQLLHALKRDKEAVKSAEAGLAMAPEDLTLRAVLEQAQAAVSQTPPATRNPDKPRDQPLADDEAAHSGAEPLRREEPPAAEPLPAPRQDDRPVLFVILAVLALGGGGGYWLAGHRLKKTARSEAEMPTLVQSDALPRMARYEIKRRVGAGGMGLVFEGVDRTLKRRVAVKQMRSEIKDGVKERADFLREAEIISHLSHPNIVAFHEVVQEPGDIFLVFDFVEGKTLADLLHEKKRLSLAECQNIFTQVCAAVSCAHRGHILHRDLKPSNIMIDAQGTVKVMDFGIAREAKETITRLTRADASGTPAYMAPEQHLGSCAKSSDIYALGVCLYEALTGRLPFPGPDFLAQKERMKYAPPQMYAPGLPKETELLFSATLALNPLHRVADAEELIGGLKSLG